MDDLLPKLLVFPPHPPPAIPLSDAQYEDGIKSQISYVSRLSDKQLMAQTSGGEGPLDVSSVQL
jgi:COP9 signalosome complex subunit 3